MPAGRGPSLQAQLLGRRLRELREDAGKTLRDAADYLQRNPSTVSRFESGEYLVRRPDFLALLELYEVSHAEERRALLKILDEVREEGWWKDFQAATGIGDQTLLDVVWLESQARVVRAVVVALLPGLLQTREYATEAIERWDPTGSPTSHEEMVNLRLQRQQILEGDNPTRLEVIMDEAALRRPLAGVEQHRRQLAHLLDMAARPNIVITVLPFSAGWHPALEGSLYLFEMPDPYPRHFGFVETPAGAKLVDDDKYEHLEWIFEVAGGLAKDLRTSAQVITEIMEGL